ncbi:phosphoglycolate phosphatase [Solemya velum gill symbiont]|nr:HAD-IA family hydrolase [Solemya velum gill symbiont]OOY99844.1 phosphoglycolate phosphatase [Solemya velum gill symbiont]OOZ02029.1 phosphoglycolate phosphatase [Solemya velum gill symbiont]OOZ04366.1 phosphoglycolate phosphatase [Solemya velum gill symbiont]OOZ06608.1 phosphoglycolate phosphatase [Solemya velum gill symbiont]OOZ08793.1 phosphoglycolate phosphatase [Solemya velum gill symbiont]
MIKAVLFDLDGTFADTAPDLAYALNRTLEAFDRPLLEYKKIRSVVSHGGVALIRLGFGLEPKDEGFESRKAHLLSVYEENIARHTRLFDGMDEVMNLLERQHMPWGIVTNKPAWLTDPLMDAMGLSERSSCIVSGDTCEKNKPHPMPLLHASELIRVPPPQCLYVGDAERDIRAGNDAGMQSAVALWGYIQDEDQPDEWNADITLETPEQLSLLLQPD